MAKYYGSITGGRSTATRTGTSTSGIRGSVQSWQGSVQSELWHNTEGKLMVRISTSDHSSSYSDNTLFTGTFEELKEAFKKISEVKK